MSLLRPSFPSLLAGVVGVLLAPGVQAEPAVGESALAFRQAETVGKTARLNDFMVYKD